MAVHTYNEAYIERTIARARRARLWFCVTAAAVILAALFVSFYPPSPAFEKHIPVWLSSMYWALVVTPLMHILWKWKSWADKLGSSLRAQTIDISPSGISATYAYGIKRQLNRSEILRAEEPSLGAGLYLRSPNRYRWLVIPRKLEDYDAIKGELINMGIPIVQTSIPPNWEEYVFMLLFISTLLCVLFVHNVRVLTANLAVAALVTAAGLYVMNADPTLRANPKMRKARLGALIPVVFATIGLLFAIYGGGL
jgi:hypothetical protein